MSVTADEIDVEFATYEELVDLEKEFDDVETEISKYSPSLPAIRSDDIEARILRRYFVT